MLKRHKLKEYHSIFFHLASVVLWLWALSLLAVIFWAIMISLTDGRDYALNPRLLFPENGFKFSNYAYAVTNLSVGGTSYMGMLFNTVWFTISFCVVRLIVTLFAAYTFAFYHFKGRKYLYGFLILQMMLPVYGQTSANYTMLLNMGLIDTPLFLISCAAGHGMNFLMLHSFFSNLSHSYAEAARIDGAGEWRIFFQINMPLSKTLIVAMFLMMFVGVWNDYQTILLYLPSYPTLATGLFRYKTLAAYTLDTPIYFAGIIMASLPVALIFIIFNKTLMENLTLGGLKG